MIRHFGVSITAVRSNLQTAPCLLLETVNLRPLARPIDYVYEYDVPTG